MKKGIKPLTGMVEIGVVLPWGGIITPIACFEYYLVPVTYIYLKFYKNIHLFLLQLHHLL